MKLKTISVGLLVFFVINTQVETQVIESLIAIKEVIDCGMAIYRFIDRLLDRTPAKVQEILQKVNEISNKIDSLDNKMDIKLDGMLNILLADIDLQAGVEILKTQLCDNIDKVDNYFDKSKQYQFGTGCGNRTLKQFIDAVLWSQESLPNVLDSTNDLFTPGVESKGFLILLYEREMLHLNHDCDEYSSPQQQMYYTYIQLIISEIKSLITLGHIYSMQQFFDETGHNYKGEFQHAREHFEKRIRKYHEIFSQQIGSLPRMIRRCDVNPPERGVNYIEMHHFSNIHFTRDSQGGCYNRATLNMVSADRNSRIDNCMRLGSHITTCPADSNSTREYIWWKDNESGIRYGPDIPCEQTQLINGVSFIAGGISGINTVCACIEKKNNGQMRISVTEQYSNIADNMVVTGVKFIMLDNTLHLQIQQTSFSNDGLVHGETVWKGVDVTENGVSIEISHKSLSPDRDTIYLDDIAVPEHYVVTGLRFVSIDNHFELALHATEYNFTSGELSSSSSLWVNSQTNPMKPGDYVNPRKLLEMSEPDDPARHSQFKYDLESNKKIAFKHSDRKKDAGQTTVPLLDAQPVETRPPFPLTGIGLSFKGYDGSGGYIAPRIYTYDVSQHIRSQGVVSVPVEISPGENS